MKNVNSVSSACGSRPFTSGLYLNRSSLNLSNGETESVKTMVVHDDVESEPALTPSKEGTLIVRQVPVLRAVRGRAAPVAVNPRAHPLTHAVSPLSSVLTLTRPEGSGAGPWEAGVCRAPPGQPAASPPSCPPCMLCGSPPPSPTRAPQPASEAGQPGGVHGALGSKRPWG